ncbi:hypothetical protein TWF788_007926 [Orbilia oligospora]|uniref:Uncharacterized protein n=1 Tax=Orbilia oligospora TaxID=2813651 RepID=A0A6G1MCQ4_ORBOL|nr:hypothetical protein TWF788_007926 [Orbilia oligospora]KAF3253558.1 hypothetical protein TWF192_003811 [Orbilia oligospora]
MQCGPRTQLGLSARYNPTHHVTAARSRAKASHASRVFVRLLYKVMLDQFQDMYCHTRLLHQGIRYYSVIYDIYVAIDITWGNIES